MTIFRDLEVCRYSDLYEEAGFLAVGWIGAECATGPARPDVIELLRREEMWPTPLPLATCYCGMYGCELCGAYAATGELFVRGEGVVYVAPKMIVHYMEAHSYAPPDAFCEAVLRTPVPAPPGRLARLWRRLRGRR